MSKVSLLRIRCGNFATGFLSLMSQLGDGSAELGERQGGTIMGNSVAVYFGGCARASAAPEFVDHCITVLNDAWWKGDVQPTVRLVPGSPLLATFAWRGEVFAYGFPSSGVFVRLGASNDLAESEQYSAAEGGGQAISALMSLLDNHLANQIARSESRREVARSDQRHLSEAWKETKKIAARG